MHYKEGNLYGSVESFNHDTKRFMTCDLMPFGDSLDPKAELLAEQWFDTYVPTEGDTKGCLKGEAERVLVCVLLCVDEYSNNPFEVYNDMVKEYICKQVFVATEVFNRKGKKDT